MRRNAIRLASVLAGALTLAVPPLAAQQTTPAAPTATTVPLTFPTTDAVLKKIWAVGMDSSRLERLAVSLFDSVGPRLTGSPGMLAASDWAIAQYKAWGIDAKRDNYGTWRGWRRGTSHIDLMSPRVRSLEGTMLAWSPGTGGKPVTAEVVVLPKFADSTEFVKWLPTAKGKIVLLSPAWPTCRGSEDWFRFGTAASKARMDTLTTEMNNDWAARWRATGKTMGLGTGSLGMRLEQAGIAGMVTSRTKISGFANTNPRTAAAGAGQGGPGGPGGGRGNAAAGPGDMRGGGAASTLGRGAPAAQGSGGWGTIEIFETYNTVAPAVTLSCEDYAMVYRLAENGMKPKLRLDLDAQLLGEVPAFNTIATIKGSEKPNEYVILSAHFDSWDGSSGATDNGTGTLMAMEAMRILKKVYPNPKRTILVGHWSSEEQGLNGSRAFAKDHPEVMQGLQALFNQDNGTGRVQSLSANAVTNVGPHLKDWYSKLPSFFTDSMSANVVSWSFRDAPATTVGGTDGAVFSCYATPSVGMQAVNWNYGSYTWHTNRDTYDKVVFDDLKHNATLAAMMAYLASEDPTFIDRTKSPGTWPANWPANCGDAPRKTNPRF